MQESTLQRTATDAVSLVCCLAPHGHDFQLALPSSTSAVGHTFRIHPNRAEMVSFKKGLEFAGLALFPVELPEDGLRTDDIPSRGDLQLNHGQTNRGLSRRPHVPLPQGGRQTQIGPLKIDRDSSQEKCI